MKNRSLEGKGNHRIFPRPFPPHSGACVCVMHRIVPITWVRSLESHPRVLRAASLAASSLPPRIISRRMSKIRSPVISEDAPALAEMTLRDILSQFHSRRLENTFADPPAAAAAAASPRPKSSAVLIGLFTHPVSFEVHVLLTQRSSAMRSHAGDVAFPGGKRDAEDGSDAECALREAEEEIGLSRNLLVPFVQHVAAPQTWSTGIHLLAPCPPALSKDNLLVKPILAAVPAPSFTFTQARSAEAAAVAGESDALAPVWLGSFTPVCSSAEVACLFSLPLRVFLTAKLPTHPFTHAYSDIKWRGQYMRLHEFTCTLGPNEYIESDGERQRRKEAAAASAAPPTLNGAAQAPDVLPSRSFRVWGLTAYLLIRAAMLVYNQQPAFDVGPAPASATIKTPAHDEQEQKDHHTASRL